MLAPGDCLTKPAPIAPDPGRPAPEPSAGGSPEPPPAGPPARVEEPEPRSFLLTLLRCLGAIHT